MATLVSVSQNAVIQAESVIVGCSHCSSEAKTPFWQILDTFRPNQAHAVVYILPILANCPKCRAPIDETALVQANPGHHSQDPALKEPPRRTSVPA